MRNRRLTLALVLLVATVPLIAAGPAPDLTPEPEAICEQPASSFEPGWEIFDFEAELEERAHATCDPNRQCTTDADCGEFGACAVWRLCICFG